MNKQLADIPATEITQYDKATVVEWVVARKTQRSGSTSTNETLTRDLRESLRALHHVREVQKDAPPQGPEGEPVLPCKVCKDLAYWIDCPTGGWWAHVTRPGDGHDAATRSFGMSKPPWSLGPAGFGYSWE